MANDGLSANGVMEIVQESTFAVFPTAPTMVWPGVVTSMKWKVVAIEEAVRGLQDSDSDVRNLPITKFKVGEEAVVVDVEFYVQNLKLFKYAMATSAGNSQTNTLSTISIGLIEPETPKYGKLVGGMLKSCELTYEENKATMGKAQIICADISRNAGNPWFSVDYSANGHATVDTSNPKKFGDITTLTWNGSVFKDMVNKIMITIDNELTVVTSVDSSLNTKIKGIVPGARNIMVEANVNMDGLDADTDALADTSGNLVLTDAEDTFTFVGVSFPEFENTFEHGGVMARTIKSENCTDLTIS